MKKPHLTEYRIHAIPIAMGRAKQWTERIQLPLAAGTTAKIDSLLREGEVRLDFIRAAIDREISLREKTSPSSPDKK
jgi:hypothetical protein